MQPTNVERMELAPGLSCARVLNGLWQVSGAHGQINPAAAVDAMFAYHDAGLTSWDLADHYGPAEDFVGSFRRRLAAERGAAALAQMQAFTKWVPRPGPMPRPLVEAAINQSLRRMGVETLDLLQFHWWDYSNPAYLDALGHLAALRDAGKIRHLALTNFDTQRLEIIAQHGIRVVSNQVQFSLVDLRPTQRMAAFCQQHGVALLAYGTLCGGLLTERFLGRPEPTRAELNTASLRKYKQMVDLWGGWDLFQELLSALNGIAARHGATIASVAVRAILDQPAVAGVIVGARLGQSAHIADTLRTFSLRLPPEDHSRIDAVLHRSRDLFRSIGDCGDEYRAL
ncbi:MAG: aldo/keto reductase [Chloroflexales bacterium]|nr:aldo/keto reductase [Chloroflexales bacterium]